MPDHATTDIQVAQKAAVLCGMKMPQDFSEANSTEALVMNAIYEDIVRDALTASAWNFVEEMEVTVSRAATAPLVDWQAAYTIPDNVLAVRTVKVNGSTVRYDIKKDKVYLDCNATDSVVLVFAERTDVQFWPPFFTMWVIFRLAAVLASSIARSGTMSKSFVEQAEMQLQQARSRDSKQVTPSRIRLGRFTAMRSGGR